MILGRTGFARKGEWTASAVYDMLDIVTYEGKEYIGKRISTGSEPSSESSDWVMLPGAPSFEIEETASGYDLTITGSDGTSETISILNGEVDREELEDALEAFRSSTDAYLAPDYDDTATYSIGDSCIHEGRLYRCVEDIPTAEPWTTEHWEPVVLSNKVAQMRKDAEVKADVVVSSAEPGEIVTISDGGDDMPVKDLSVSLLLVQSGSGDPSPDNVRPISGWTGVEVRRTDVNLFGGNDLRDGVLAGVEATDHPDDRYVSFQAAATYTQSFTAYRCRFKEGVRYTIILTLYSTQGYSNIQVNFTDGTNAVFPNPSSANTKTTIVYTTPAGKSLYYIRKRNSSGGTRIYYDESGVFEGVLTASDFKPYVGNTYPISWQSSAGTVYGGSLDVTTGLLTVNTGSIVVDGTLINQVATASTGVQSARVAFTFPTGMGLVACDTYPIVTQVPQSGSIGARQVNSTVYLYNDAFTDLATAQALLNANNVTIIYRLATPIEYQLTPTQIATLLGTNNFWSNGNGSLDLEYRADTKLYIQQLTKPSEDDMVANSNIPANTYFTIGNALYLSTAAIAAGEKIEPDTNCTRKSLADALNDLHD